MKRAWQILAHKRIVIERVTCVSFKNKQLKTHEK